MPHFVAVTDAEIVRAHRDPAYRRLLLAKSLEQLLTELSRHRQEGAANLKLAQQLREGSLLAVKLADLIRRVDEQRPNKPSRPVID